MPPFRRQLLHLTTEFSSDTDQFPSISNTASPAGPKPCDNQNLLATPVPPSPLLASLNSRSPVSSKSLTTPKSEERVRKLQQANNDSPVNSSWPLLDGMQVDSNTSHRQSEFKDATQRNGVEAKPKGVSSAASTASGNRTVPNFSRPLKARAIRCSTPPTDLAVAKIKRGHAATTTTTVQIPTTMKNAMKETASTRAKRRSLPATTPATAVEVRYWSAGLRKSIQLPLDAKTPSPVSEDPHVTGKTNCENADAVAPRSFVTRGAGLATIGVDARAPIQSLKRRSSSNSSQASLNERYSQRQDCNEPPPVQSTTALIGIAWSGIADEWWPPRSSSLCRYTQAGQKAHIARRLSSINEAKEEPVISIEHDRHQPARSRHRIATPPAKHVGTSKRDSQDRRDQGKGQISNGSQHGGQDHALEKRRIDTPQRQCSKDSRDQGAKDVWGSTIVIKKRREGEMMKVREKAVWW